MENSLRNCRKLIGVVIMCVFIIIAGCIGGFSPLNSRTSPSVTNITIGPNHGLPADPGPDKPGVDSPPVIETNSTHIIIIGEIPGIGDLNCLDATASATTKPNDTLAVTIKSVRKSPPSGCNETRGFFSYQAIIASDEPHPEQLNIQHISGGEKTNNWTGTIDGGIKEKLSTSSTTKTVTRAEPLTTHVSTNRTE